MGISDYLAELVHAQLEDRKPQAIPQGITIEEIMDIAKRNHMEYLLLGALLRLDNFSESYIGELRRRVMNSLMRTMAQVTEFNDLEKKFEAAGIKNQAMKGARMRFLYPMPQLREMSDVDILVDAACMKQAAQLLSENGYTLAKSIKHHDIYIKQPFMALEVHKVMYDKTVDGGQYKYFSNFSKAIPVEGKKYTYDFNREDFYIYMMAHMAKHFIQWAAVYVIWWMFTYIRKNTVRF
ncbi:MAG: nucleotidyltransferase family protein [Lachnospiraceae bacterium]|nr:nucleotidyltransferase family protein [Lachnospiraceae bacterium]